MGSARARAAACPRARSVRHAHHAVAEALRLHLAHMTSPFTFDGLLADHRAAFLLKRLVLVPCMRLLRGLSRSRQRDQRKHQHDRLHLHLSLRVGFAIREINLRASRAFCEIFVTLACRPYVACRRCRACDRRGTCSAPRLRRDRSRGRADMKRRESGNSARHARRDGWRAPLLTILKYCRHKTMSKIVMENTDQRECKIAPGRNVDPDSRTAQQFG